MHRKRRYLAYCLLALIDVVLISCSYPLASILYLGTADTLGGLSQIFFPYDLAKAYALVIAFSFLLAVLYAVSSVYGNTYIGLLKTAIPRIIAINTIVVVVIAALLYLTHMDDVSRVTLFLAYVISTIVVSLKCWIAFHVFLAFRKNRRRIQKTVVVGNGSLAKQYAANIHSNSSRLEQIEGYVSTDSALRNEINTEKSAESELGSYLGTVNDLNSILLDSNFEKVVIAIEPEEYPNINAVMAAADKFGLELELVPFYSDIMPRRPDMDSVGDIKLVNIRSMPLSNPFNSALKRSADIAISSVIIVAFCWLYAIIAIGVKASSPGPVMFKQRRVGKNNKPFNMLKFRSMRVNDESETAWSTDEDPRKTKFGSFIRKFSLDEFPQFFNVFVGNMSIVGPRPEIPHFVEEFRDNYPRYMLRHQVRPGITGWAQVNGLRGDTSIKKRVDADLWYIDHWSPWLDTRIFFRTIFGGFINSEKINTKNQG